MRWCSSSSRRKARAASTACEMLLLHDTCSLNAPSAAAWDSDCSCSLEAHSSTSAFAAAVAALAAQPKGYSLGAVFQPVALFADGGEV